MDEKEAIARLRVHFEIHDDGRPTPFLDKAVSVAYKSLEKQIPKKPITKQWSSAQCPCCGCELSESVGDGYYKHYTHLKVCDCGQKLDWS